MGVIFSLFYGFFLFLKFLQLVYTDLVNFFAPAYRLVINLYNCIGGTSLRGETPTERLKLKEF